METMLSLAHGCETAGGSSKNDTSHIGSTPITTTVLVDYFSQKKQINMFKNISTNSNFPKTLLIRNTPEGMV